MLCIKKAKGLYHLCKNAATFVIGNPADITMDTEQTAGVIKALREERSELENELKALDSIIARFERRNSTASSPMDVRANSNKPVPASLFPPQQNFAPVNRDNDFPRSADLEAQLVYVLNSLKKAHRFPEIQDQYTKLSGSKRNIRKDLQALRKSSVLTAIKYNNNSTQVFQGLPEWVVEADSGPVFKEEFIDIDERNFPTGIWKSVKIGEDKE